MFLALYRYYFIPLKKTGVINCTHVGFFFLMGIYVEVCVSIKEMFHHLPQCFLCTGNNLSTFPLQKNKKNS